MCNRTVSFFVPGLPAPGGSKKAFYNKHLGRAIIVDDCKRNASWKNTVKVFAVQAFDGAPLSGPLELTIEFRMPRPKGHYRTGRNANMLRDSAPAYPTTKPDATKLIRSTEDALTGILWGDDAQVVVQHGSKVYAQTPGAMIVVSPLPGATVGEQ